MNRKMTSPKIYLFQIKVV